MNKINHNSNIKVGEFLSTKRLQEGLSLEEAAQAIGLTPQELKDCELGVHNLQLNQLYAIANILNINPSELMELFYTLVYNQDNQVKKTQ